MSTPRRGVRIRRDSYFLTDLLTLLLPILWPFLVFIAGMTLQNITLSGMTICLKWIQTVIVPSLPLFAAPALWALLGLLLGKLHWGRPSEPPNKESTSFVSRHRWFRRTGANFQRKRNRCFKAYCRQHQTEPTRQHASRHSTHLGLRKKVNSRIARHDLDRYLTQELLQHLHLFYQKIQFRCVNQHQKRRPRRCPSNPASQQVPGIPMSHLQPLHSLPLVKTYLAAADLPNHLQQVAKSLLAALTPSPDANMVKNPTFPVIWDSGASVTISPHRCNFVGPIKAPPLHLSLRGIAKGLRIEGVGHVAWAFVADNGMLRTLKVPAYLVTKSQARLLATTSLLQTYPGETITQTSTHLQLSGGATGSPSSISIPLTLPAIFQLVMPTPMLLPPLPLLAMLL